MNTQDNQQTKPTSMDGVSVSDAKTDALYDSAYLAGVTLGWNLGVEGDNEGLAAVHRARNGYLKALAQPQQPDAPDLMPPATSRDKWMYRQGWRAALDVRSHATPQSQLAVSQEVAGHMWRYIGPKAEIPRKWQPVRNEVELEEFCRFTDVYEVRPVYFAAQPAPVNGANNAP